MNMSIERPFRTIAPIFQGKNISQEVGSRLGALNFKKALVIYDKGIESIGLGPEIAENIKSAGLEVVQSNLVQADPPSNSVNEIAKIGRENEVDCIVAVGGGSAIDTAKGVNILLTNEGDCETYFDLTLPQNPGKFLVAIPTTAGTGSESTGGGIITNSQTGFKGVIAGAATIVNLVLVDPNLTLGVPSYITATTGFDVLAHGVDGILSILANDVTKSIALESIRLFRENIETAVTDGSNYRARNNMMTAASLGGLVITGGNCSLSHSFGHALGSAYHTAHGNCVAIFLPPTIEYVAEQKPEEIKDLAKAFGIDIANSSVNELAISIGKEISALGKKVGLKEIKEVEPNPENLYKLIEAAQKDVMTASSPRELTEEGAKWIIQRAYDY